MLGSNVPSREGVVHNIIALLVTEKPSYNIPISKLEHSYVEVEGERIPYRALGYPTIVTFLRTIPEVELVQRDGYHLINFLGSEKSRHISELVAKQKTSTRSSRGRSATRRRIPNSYFTRSQSTVPHKSFDNARLATDVLNMIRDSERGVSKTTLLHKVRERKSGYFDMQMLDEVLSRLGGQIGIEDTMVYLKAQSRTSKIKYFRDNAELLPPYKSLVDDLDDIEPFPRPVQTNASASSPTEKSAQNEENPLAVVPHSHFEVANDDDSIKRLDVNDPRIKSEIEMIVNDRVRFRLEKLIQNQPQGIWCSAIAKAYLEEYKIPLEWEEMGFTSLSDLILHLPEIFYCVQASPWADFRVYDAKNKDGVQLPMKPSLASVYSVYQLEDDESAIPTGPLPQTTINRLIPDDVVALGETIGQVSVADFNQEPKGYEEVVVCDAFTPSFFWIHLRKKILKLDAMMSNLHDFYEEKAPSYRVPLIILERGLNIACKFFGKWHRGIVREIDPDKDSMTNVLFYDFGTLKKYPARDIHFLHRSFAGMPAQAVPCGLYNVQPPPDSPKGSDGNCIWSISTSRQFVQRVHEKPLVAVCAKFFHENNSLLLSLTDTLGTEDINIAKWMVDEKLAIHGSMEVPVADPNNHANYVEDYGEDNSEATVESSNPEGTSASNSQEVEVQNRATIIQGLLLLTETYKQRIIELGVELSSTISGLRNLLTNPANKDVNVVMLQSMMDKVLEERRQFNVNPRDMEVVTSLNPLKNDESQFLEELYDSDEGSKLILSSVEVEPLRSDNNWDSQVSESDTYRNSTDFGEARSTDNDFADLIDSDDIQLMMDEESCYLHNGFLDSNPFKQDLLSSNNSEGSFSLRSTRVPPPIPPRTGRPKTQDLVPFPVPRDRKSIQVNNSCAKGNFNGKDKMVNGENRIGSGARETSILENVEKNAMIENYRPSLPLRTEKKEHSDESNRSKVGNCSVNAKKIPDCLKVDLSKGPVYIFIIDSGGWICLDQFRKAFTEFTDNLPIQKILAEVEIDRKIVHKTDNVFCLINEKLEMEEDIGLYYLIPVGIVLMKVLMRLNIISTSDVRELIDSKGKKGHFVGRECQELLKNYNHVMRLFNH